MRILVVCGAGASSTFLAQRLRRHLPDDQITAGSLDTVDDPRADRILLGAHLGDRLAELEARAACPIDIIPPAALADLSGAELAHLVRSARPHDAATTEMKEQQMSATISGTGIGLGSAHGPIARMSAPLTPPVEGPAERAPEEELQRAKDATQAVADELRSRSEQVSGTAAEVLQAQAMMAGDRALSKQIAKRIEAGSHAEWAVHASFADFREMLKAAGGYMAERAADLDDVAQRIVAHLRGVPAPGVPDPGHPFVLLARDLSPADTASLDLDRVRALITTEGGPTAHTAILARENGIVAIVGASGADELADGQTVIVDAAGGTITADPSDDEITACEEREAQRREALAQPPSPGALADGTPLPLLANIGSADGVPGALAAGAEGVGLFRTEFLFLSASEAPSQESQAEAYTAVLKEFPGQKVTVRMLDAGADKPLPFLNDADEDNPALGLRGLRALQVKENLLRTQLAALAAAQEQTEADLWVMAPMIATVEEAEYFHAIAAEYELKTAGVMVEVPSSALLADEILAVSDFASIGTNDLTQYTLAADRLLDTVSRFQDPWHPAVLRLVEMIGAAGGRTGKPVGVCGEAAADPMLAVVLVGLGVNSLSMAPASIADVRQQIGAHTLEQAQAVARAALAASNAADARTAAMATSTSVRSAD